MIPESLLSVLTHGASTTRRLHSTVLRKLLIFAAFAPMLTGADPAPPVHAKTVLVLHSYYKGYRWTDDEGRGIDSVLLPELGASNIYIEYMDTKRFYGRDSLEQFPDVYRRQVRLAPLRRRS